MHRNWWRRASPPPSARRVDNVVIGFPESLFVRVNALAPGLVDRALRANDRKAAAIFTEAQQRG